MIWTYITVAFMLGIGFGGMLGSGAVISLIADSSHPPPVTWIPFTIFALVAFGSLPVLYVGDAFSSRMEKLEDEIRNLKERGKQGS